MGSWHSIQHVDKTFKQSRFVLEPLQLTTEDQKRLYALFKTAAVHHSSDRIPLHNLCSKLGLKDLAYFAKVTYEHRPTGKLSLNYVEFALSLWDYCTVSADSILEYSFHLYDEMKIGSIPRASVHTLLLDCYRALATDQQTVDLFSAEVEGALETMPLSISFTALKNFLNFRPDFLSYISSMHDYVQSMVLGLDRWIYLREQPITMLDGTVVTIDVFKSMKLYDALIHQGDLASKGLLEEDSSDSVNKSSAALSTTTRISDKTGRSDLEPTGNDNELMEPNNAISNPRSKPLPSNDRRKHHRYKSREHTKSIMQQYIVTDRMSVLPLKNLKIPLFPISPNRIYPQGSQNMLSNSFALDTSEVDSFMQSMNSIRKSE